MRKYISYIAVILVLAGCKVPEKADRNNMSYFFDQPARIWEETLPLGNGRIGMMPDGGVESENIVLNEISLWSGARQDANNPWAYYSLGNIRRLLFQGRNDEAQALMYSSFVCKGEGSGQGNGAKVPYGSFQLLGNLLIKHVYADGEEKDKTASYRRELNIAEAMSNVSFNRAGVNYEREAFTSFKGDVGVIRLTADRDKALNFSISMNRPECYAVSKSGTDLLMNGQLTNGTDGKGMKYSARVRVLLPKGGTQSQTDTLLSVRNASEAVILVAMATDYFGKDAESETLSQLEALKSKDYSSLKKEHIESYKKMFDRVSFELGSSERDEWPIQKRLEAFQSSPDDPGLVSLYFQFGRYLLISSTRPGLLPPNLQGLWANTVQTPWNGDYHLNINLQMNLWPAEVTNLSELHLPMIEWTKQQVKSGEQTAKVYYNSRGWVTHILGNPWEFTAPGEHPSWGATNTSAAWLCEHLYTHYLYTQDKSYLAEVYPVMRGAALFFVDMLVEDPRNNYLVSAPTTSPENAFMFNGRRIHTCAGSTMDNQIIRELFTNTIQSAEILGIDADFRNELAEKRGRLSPTRIGSDGRIMEWLEEFEESEPHHRHVSHLYGLYPGNEISVEKTPDLAKAARKTLEVRGDKSTGWSMAWKINFWARLHDGNHAGKLLGDLLTPAIRYGDIEYNGAGGGTAPNLFCSHPPFQIDGNFGATAGIAEMLVQSHSGIIELLPAIPDTWKKGSFCGLKVLGGGEAGAKWANGLLLEASLKAGADYSYSIRLPENSAQLSIFINRKPVSKAVAGGILSLDLKKGEELTLKFQEGV